MPKSVVVIDDSVFISKQISDFFTDVLGFNVLAVGRDGNEAVNLYKKFKPDILTLDLTMPERNGVDALQEIIDTFPDARVLIISAVHGPSMLDCMNLGAKGYIEKPLRFSEADFIEDFKETINEVLRV